MVHTRMVHTHMFKKIITTLMFVSGLNAIDNLDLRAMRKPELIEYVLKIDNKLDVEFLENLKIMDLIRKIDSIRKDALIQDTVKYLKTLSYDELTKKVNSIKEPKKNMKTKTIDDTSVDDIRALIDDTVNKIPETEELAETHGHFNVKPVKSNTDTHINKAKIATTLALMGLGIASFMNFKHNPNLLMKTLDAAKGSLNALTVSVGNQLMPIINTIKSSRLPIPKELPFK